MAITRIHPVKATVQKTIKYICNPSKTNGELLISSYATSPKTAQYDFKYALSKSKGNSDPNLAYHLIQSFAPGEVSYEEAHRIGIELADKLLEGKYSYVIATHVDHNHVHNHICFCAADNIDHKKYHDCTKSYYHIRELNDQLCKEHNLSVITPGPTKAKKYNEWLADKNGISWKTQLRNDIDELIKKANDYDEFLSLLKAKGYEIKGESFEDKSPKYISFKPIASGNWIRGRDKSLGSEYTKECIKARIESNQKELSKAKIPFPKKRTKNILKDYSKQRLIDTDNKKFQNSPGLQHWAKVQNLKIATSSYSNSKSLKDLQEKIASKTVIANETKSTIVELEHELKEMSEILKYAKQYVENKPYHYRYQKSKNQEQYFRNHDMQLILYDGAVNELKRHNINLKNLDFEKMASNYQVLWDKKEELKKAYKSAEKDIFDMQKQLENIEKYVEISKENVIVKNQEHSL